jgi:hypothetical protein
MVEFKDVTPLLQQLVWPGFVGIILVVFRHQASTLLTTVTDAIARGRSLQVGEWFKIGEEIKVGDVPRTEGNDPANDIQLSEFGTDTDFLEKGSAFLLDQIQNRDRTNPGRRIETLIIKSGQAYVSTVLRRYIGELGIRFVVYQKERDFDGWIDASMFSSQLFRGSVQGERLTYMDLRGFSGIRQDTISPTTKATDALSEIESRSLSSIAVVENGSFRFMLTREALISKILVARLMFEKTKADHPKSI